MLTEFSGLKFYKFLPKLPLPGPLFVTWLGPKPIGITPPRYFGLPERYFLGLTPGEIEDILSGEGAKQDAEKGKQYEVAQRAAAALGLFAKTDLGLATDVQLNAAEQIYERLRQVVYYQGPIPIVLDLPYGLLNRIDVERGRRLRAVTAGTLAVLTLQVLQAQNPPDP